MLDAAVERRGERHGVGMRGRGGRALLGCLCLASGGGSSVSVLSNGSAYMRKYAYIGEYTYLSGKHFVYPISLCFLQYYVGLIVFGNLGRLGLISLEVRESYNRAITARVLTCIMHTSPTCRPFSQHFRFSADENKVQFAS